MRLLDPCARSPLMSLRGFDAAFAQGRHLPIAVFDFDGVLCAPTEDLVYKLPEKEQERERLSALARDCGLDPDIYDVPYLRHLLLQVALQRRHTLPEPGPLLDLARELSRAKRPFFILSARSGQAAIERALGFLAEHGLTAQEIFFVGRVAKGQQLAFVGKMPRRRSRLVFFDDSPRHSLNSRRQSIEAFETVRVLWARPDWAAAEKLLSETLYSTGADRHVLNAA